MQSVDDFLKANQANTPQTVDQFLSSNSANPSGDSTGLQTVDQFLSNNQDSQSINSGDPWENFKQSAQKVVQMRGLPQSVLPVMLGQAAIESARGQSAPGNNYFGIKGSGNAGNNNLATQEYGNGGYYGENSDFAAYKTPEDSINSYLNLIMGYHGVPEAIQGGTPDDIIRAIESNGYATSPTYVENVENTPEFRG